MNQQQIASTGHDRQNMNELSEHVYAIGKICHHKLTSAERVAIATCAGLDPLNCDTVPAISRVMKDRVLYHTRMHSTGGARNNRVCMFHTADEQGFALIDILPLTQPIAVVKVYKLDTTSILGSIHPPRTRELQESNCDEQLSKYLIQVKELSLVSTLKAITLSDIKKKCLHISIKGQSMNYIGVVPNPYEHH